MPLRPPRTHIVLMHTPPQPPRPQDHRTTGPQTDETTELSKTKLHTSSCKRRHIFWHRCPVNVCARRITSARTLNHVYASSTPSKTMAAPLLCHCKRCRLFRHSAGIWSSPYEAESGSDSWLYARRGYDTPSIHALHYPAYPAAPCGGSPPAPPLVRAGQSPPKRHHMSLGVAWGKTLAARVAPPSHHRSHTR